MCSCSVKKVTRNPSSNNKITSFRVLNPPGTKGAFIGRDKWCLYIQSVLWKRDFWKNVRDCSLRLVISHPPSLSLRFSGSKVRSFASIEIGDWGECTATCKSNNAFLFGSGTAIAAKLSITFLSFSSNILILLQYRRRCQLLQKWVV